MPRFRAVDEHRHAVGVGADFQRAGADRRRPPGPADLRPSMVTPVVTAMSTSDARRWPTGSSRPDDRLALAATPGSTGHLVVLGRGWPRRCRCGQYRVPSRDRLRPVGSGLAVSPRDRLGHRHPQFGGRRAGRERRHGRDAERRRRRRWHERAGVGNGVTLDTGRVVLSASDRHRRPDVRGVIGGERRRRRLDGSRRRPGAAVVRRQADARRRDGHDRRDARHRVGQRRDRRERSEAARGRRERPPSPARASRARPERARPSACAAMALERHRRRHIATGTTCSAARPAASSCIEHAIELGLRIDGRRERGARLDVQRAAQPGAQRRRQRIGGVGLTRGGTVEHVGNSVGILVGRERAAEQQRQRHGGHLRDVGGLIEARQADRAAAARCRARASSAPTRSASPRGRGRARIPRPPAGRRTSRRAARARWRRGTRRGRCRAAPRWPTRAAGSARRRRRTPA